MYPYRIAFAAKPRAHVERAQTLSITLYGATDCDDTQRTRERLQALGVPFREVNIDHHRDADHFVIFVNGGFRSTPTVVIGEGRRKILITEPSDEEIDTFVREAGYVVS